MTGRRGRVVTLSNGTVQYQLRTEVDVSVEMLNITEKQRFMDGEKNIAIISEAASSGISLQSDKRAKVNPYLHVCNVHVQCKCIFRSATCHLNLFGVTLVTKQYLLQLLLLQYARSITYFTHMLFVLCCPPHIYRTRNEGFTSP